MKYGIDKSGVLHDVTQTDPRLLFSTGYAAQFIEVPDEAQNGWVADGDGYAPPPKYTSLDDAKSDARQRINAARDAAIIAGMDYVMPDGTPEIVQMADGDRQNLIGLAIEARDLKAAGVTAAEQELWPASNVRYSLTPAEVIDLTNAALVHHNGLVKRGRDRKDVIDAIQLADYATADEAIAAVEAIVW